MEKWNSTFGILIDAYNIYIDVEIATVAGLHKQTNHGWLGLISVSILPNIDIYEGK